MAQAKTYNNSLLFEELESRLLLSADGFDAVAEQVVEQDVNEEPIVIATMESPAEEPEDSGEQLGDATAADSDTADIKERNDETETTPETAHEVADPEIADTHTAIPKESDNVIADANAAEPFPAINASELVFVNDNIDDYQQLVTDITKNEEENRTIEVIVLDSDKDGVEQVSAVLTERSELDAIHIISHGTDGAFALGSNWLDNADLLANSETISAWSDTLSEEADILLYGCNIAVDRDGKALTDTLAALTGADVTASDDTTGHANLGGNWELEYGNGTIETSIAVSQVVQAEYETTLATDTFTVSNTNSTGTGSLHEAILNANANSGITDTITFNIPGAGPHVINLTGALPTIMDRVIIDGTTDPDFAGTPIIVLDGSGAGSADGLILGAGSDGSIIRGLVITNFSGSGIVVDESSNNTITSNYIGIGADGETQKANGGKGIYVKNSSGNTIGGSSSGDRNVISGNVDHGIQFYNSGNNTVIGNYIGTNAAGNAVIGNTGDGIYISSGSSGNTIGGDRTAGEGNLISGNQDGIQLNDPSTNNNVILGNYIGTDSTGTKDFGNSRHGVVIYKGVQGTEVGRTGIGEGNVISGNDDSGIVINGKNQPGTTNNSIVANIIGLNADGTAAVGNGKSGIEIYGGATGNLIGGSTATAGNVISGNVEAGITISESGTTLNVIQSNYIGVDSTGNVGLGNGADGIKISDGASNNTIGGDRIADEGNVISGNRDGIKIDQAGSDNNKIYGNYIGTNSAGTATLGNMRYGVVIFAGVGTEIGGTGTGQGNIISGNNTTGILIDGIGSALTTANIIVSNYVGTDVSGTIDLGNGHNGIAFMGGTQGNIIGGLTVNARNIISGNDNNGIWIGGTGTSSNTVQGNWIGFGADGRNLGNLYSGISIEAGASDNLIGGTVVGAGNNIGNNGWDGVLVKSGIGNSILRNSIVSNVEIGIDLGGDDVTDNDPGDTDSGPNNLQNFPIITQADLNGSTLTLNGTLDTDGSTTQYRIEFYGNTAGTQDATNGEGQTYLGFTTVTTDNNGDATFTDYALTGVSLNAGDYVTATATVIDDPAQVASDDSLAYGSTSEFAKNVAVDEVLPLANIVPGPQEINEDTSLTFSAGNGNQISISDADAGTDLLEVTLSVDNGILTLAGTTGLTFIAGGNNTATMTYTGTLSDINTALDGLIFTPNADFNGSASLQITTYEDATLLASYSFDDTGNLGADSGAGTTYDGTATTGAISVNDATRGDVLSLDGNSHVEIPGFFGNPKDVTLAAWVNITTFDKTGTDIISLGDNLILRYEKWPDYTNFDGIYYDSTVWNTIRFKTTLNLAGDGWHHVAYSVDDSNNTHAIYFDGVEVASAAMTGSINYNLGTNTYLGSHGAGSDIWNLNGLIDDARIYDRSLNAAEIAGIMNTSPGKDSDVIAITVNPVNDAPAITIETDDSAAETLTETNAALTSSGTLTVTDLDISDTVTSSVSGVATSGTTTGLASDNAALQAMLTSTTNVIDGSQTSGTLTWNFNSNPEAFDYLAVDENLTLTYTITVTDSQGATGTHDVVITINGTNDQPIVSDVTANATEDGATVNGNFDVTDTDTADSHTFAITSELTEGSVVNNNDGTFTFDPGTDFQDLAEGETRDVTFTYTATDNSGAANATSSEGTATITVTGTNDQPIVSDVTAKTTEDGATVNGNFDVTDTDTADSHTFAITSELTEGSVINNNDGTFTFDPGTDFQDLAEGETRDVTFTYTATDNSGAANATSSEGTATITVTGTNDQPAITIETDDSAAETLTETNAALTSSGTLTVTDLDISDTVTSSVSGVATSGTTTGLASDNAALQAMLTSTANVVDGSQTSGTLTWNFDSNPEAFDYLAVDENLTLTYTITVTDNQGATGTHDVVITINGTNDQPIVSDVTANATEDGATVNGNFDVTDADTADSHTFAITSELTEGSVVNNNDGTFTFDPGTDFQDLAEGETRDVTFTYTATDNSGAANATSSEGTATITVTGTNDQPAITIETDDSAAETLTETNAALTSSGTLTVTDLDISDTVTSSVSGVATSGTTTGLASDNAALQAMLTSTANVVDGSQTSGTLTWNFDSNPEAFDYLAVGENLTLTYTITVTDSQGATGTHDVVITINGTNDAPAITIETDDSAAETLTETNAALTSSGTLTVTDLDISDTVTSSVSGVATSGTTTGLASDNAALQAMLTSTANVVDGSQTSGTLTWNFDSNPEAFDYLAVDENLTLTYTITVTDSQGATGTHDVVITINGTNDAPAITIETDDSAAETLTETNAALTSSGTLTVTDLDISDTVTSSVSGVATSGTTTGLASDNAALQAMLTSTANVVDGSQTSGTLTWNFDSNPEAFDYLAVGENLTLTYTITVTDSQGATGTHDVVITINGTNDVALIGGVDTGSVKEDVAVVDNKISTSGKLTIDDPDAGESSFHAGKITGKYGALVINTDGKWTYTSDNNQATIQQLDSGESITDTIETTSFDGTTHDIIITIHGTDEPSSGGGSGGSGETGADNEQEEDQVVNGSLNLDELNPEFEKEESEVIENANEDISNRNDNSTAESQQPQNEAKEDPDTDGSETETNIDDNALILSDDETLEYYSNLERNITPAEASTGFFRHSVTEKYHGKKILQENLFDEKTAFELFPISSDTAAPDVLTPAEISKIMLPNTTLLHADLEMMHQEVDSSFGKRAETHKNVLYITSAASFSFAAGVASYLLRAGSLLSSFLTTAPLWRSYDPIAVLLVEKTKSKKDKKSTPTNTPPEEPQNDQEAEDMFSETEDR